MAGPNCYVCRELVDSGQFEAIYVTTKYTKTPITELIQSLLGADELRNFETSDSICLPCLDKFNQYDLARLTVHRVETELKHALLSAHVCRKPAETDCSEMDVAHEGEDTPLEDDASIVDSQGYQHDHDNEMIGVEVILRENNDDISEEEQIVYVVVDEESAESGPEENDRLENTIIGAKSEPEEADWRRQHGLQAWLETIAGNQLEVYCKICEQKVAASKTFLIAHGKSRVHIRKMSDQGQAYTNSPPKRKKKSSANKTEKKVPRTGTIYQYPDGQIIFRCDVCHQEAPNASDLAEHIALHGNKFKCTVCLSVRIGMKSIIDHMRIHEPYQGEESLAVELKKHICQVCGEDALSIYLLSQHMKTHRTIIGKMSQSGRGLESLRCHFCNHEEHNIDDLVLHVPLHGNQPKCVFCPKVFPRKDVLRYHMRVHSGKTYYQCDKCGVVFIHESSLVSHFETTHTAERTEHCSVCSMSFKRRRDLEKHELTHRGEKNHACPECDKCFAHRSNMRKHYNARHLGIIAQSKRHLCIICNTTFEKVAQLEQHYIKIHSRITVGYKNEAA